MTAWQELVKMALLGTEKMPLQAAVLPPEVQSLLDNSDVSDRESHFYKAAALTLTYRKAGQLATKAPLPGLSTATRESRQFAPIAYISVLKKLFEEDKHKYPVLFYLLFEKIKSNNLVLPHEHVYEVLRLLDNADFKKHKVLINEVIGERGRWLRQWNPSWDFAEIKDDSTILAEGTAAERRQVLYVMREQDPNKYFEFVRSNWAKDNARERKDYLNILAEKPQLQELEFVQAIYSALLDEKASAKAINQEIKETAVLILLGTPSSELFKSVVARLTRYVSAKKAFLGLQSKTVLTLPGEADDFLNARVMNLEFGHAATPSTNELLTEYWFCYFLERLHPVAWEMIFNTEDWDIIINSIGETDKQIGGNKKQQRQAFHCFLARSIGKNKYRPAGINYLNKYAAKDHEPAALSMLNREELEKYCLKNIDMGEPSQLRNIILQDGWRWSPSLSRHVLDGLMKNEQAAYPNAQFGLSIAVHFNDSILPELHRLATQDDANQWHQQYLRSNLVVPLIKFIGLRIEIEQL